MKTRYILTLWALLASWAASATSTGIEVVEVGTSANGTTYRVYATFDSPTDQLVAVYGTVSGSQNAPLIIQTTTTFYQNPFGSDFAQVINPLFYALAPGLTEDSWLTIGSESSAGTGGVSQVGMEPYWAGFNSGNGFNINTFLGASWFIVPGSSSDAIAGADLKVLIAQLTTTGVVNVTINYQYDDVGGNTFNAEGLTATFPVIEEGCTNATACNYDATADVDDGSCAFPGSACNDNDAMTTGDVYGTDCGCVGVPVVVGCMDANACNYNPLANTTGACELPGTSCDDGNANTINDTWGTDCACSGVLFIPGCTDASACNYNDQATSDNGTCVFPQPGEDCSGACLNDLNQNGLCDELEVFGCTAATADNYNPDATTDNGTCVWAGGVVTGLAYEVITENGVAGTTTYRIYAEFASTDVDVIALYGTNTAPWQLTTTTSFYQDSFGGNFASNINPSFFALVPSLAFDSWLTLGTLPGQPDAAASVGMEVFLPSFAAGGNLNVNTFLGGSVYTVPGASTQGIPVNGRVLLAQVTTSGTVTAKYNLQYRNAAGVSTLVEGMTLTFPQVEVPLGCTDPEAQNYDPSATLDDGTCVYPQPSYSGLSWELVAENQPTAGMRTFRVYANFDNPNDQLTAVFAQDGNPMSIASSSSFYQNPAGGAFANQINPLLIGLDPTLAFDSWLTIGGVDQDVDLLTVGTTAPANSFESGGAFAVDNALGASWFVLPDQEPLAFPDAQGRVLIAQLTTAGVVDLNVNLQYRAQNGTNPQVFAQTLTFPNLVFGCTDPAACNYDEDAEANDGSCTYAQTYYDCAGVCLNDTDGDGVCNELEIPGCTLEGAANYDPAATDNDGSCQFPGCTDSTACNFDSNANLNDGTCVFAVAFYDCLGNCLNDSDGDGVCNELEIPGCTDSSASNFNPNATDEDGSCAYPGCTNPDADNFNPGANVDDGSCILGACTYANADNYNAAATYDDGSCVFGGCTNPAAINYQPLATVNDGSCVLAVLGCTYPDADNYNPAATADNGTCTFTVAAECPFDVDGNGTIGSADLLEFLAVYGTACN